MNKKIKQFPLEIKVQQNVENPEPVEVIARAVIDVAEAFKKISAGRLKRHTIVVLIKDQTGLSQRDINQVLDACENLAKEYTK